VAVCELSARAFRPAVGELNRREELRLQPVGVVLVELLVRRAESRERKADSLNAPAKPSSSSCRASALVCVI